MIKIDLITGFLGSGKTTFLKKYAKHYIDQGQKIGILENDHGAINVDMLLLNELRSDNCELEMVAGGCDADCHRRRFKTKLIAMGMAGYDRVIVEPSGIFDVDEFFDALREAPLDKWYEIGNVIAIVDANLSPDISPQSDFLLASQVACAGAIVLSRTQEVDEAGIEEVAEHIRRAAERIDCNRDLRSLMVAKPWDEFTEGDMQDLESCGYKASDYIKLRFREEFSAVYFLDYSIDTDELVGKIKRLFDSEFTSEMGIGRVFRVKGFLETKDGSWQELNANADGISIEPIEVGQKVFIVIGEGLDEGRLREYMKAGGLVPGLTDDIS